MSKRGKIMMNSNGLNCLHGKLPKSLILITSCLVLLAGCSAKPAASISPDEDKAQTAYSNLLSGDISLLGDTQLGQEWADLILPNSELEYTTMDLDGDGVSELLVQWKENPGNYNAVFHYEDGQLICWNHDTVEMTRRDYPLQDGTIVQQYDYAGCRYYTLFRYQSSGEKEEVASLFARDEPMVENDSNPCPYYEVDGKEVDEAAFNAKLKEAIDDKLLTRSAWTAV